MADMNGLWQQFLNHIHLGVGMVTLVVGVFCGVAVLLTACNAMAECRRPSARVRAKAAAPKSDRTTELIPF